MVDATGTALLLLEQFRDYLDGAIDTGDGDDYEIACLNRVLDIIDGEIVALEER